MAKRLSRDEEPYRPVRENLLRDQKESQFPEKSLIASVIKGAQVLQEVPKEESPAERKVAGDVIHQGELQAPKKVANLSGKRERRSRKELSEGFELHSVHMRFKVVESERTEIMNLVSRYSSALGTRVSFSHLMRSLLNILRHSDKEIVRAMEKATLHRPANENPLGLAEFEHELAHLLLEGVRKGPPLIRNQEEE